MNGYVSPSAFRDFKAHHTYAVVVGGRGVLCIVAVVLGCGDAGIVNDASLDSSSSIDAAADVNGDPMDAGADGRTDGGDPVEDVGSPSDTAHDIGEPDVGMGPSLACDAPHPLQAQPGGYDWILSTTVGLPPGLGCGTGDCPSHFFEIELDRRRTVRINAGGAYDTAIGIYQSCDASALEVCDDEVVVGDETIVRKLDRGRWLISLGGNAPACSGNYSLYAGIATEFPTQDARTSLGPLNTPRQFTSAGDFIEQDFSINQMSMRKVWVSFTIDRQGCVPEFRTFVGDREFESITVRSGSGPVRVVKTLDGSGVAPLGEFTFRLESTTECESGSWAIRTNGELLTSGSSIL